jgi:pimeloyl-ACP methyl ester carboxylesterase
MRRLIFVLTLSLLYSCSDGGGVNTGSCLISDTITSNSMYGEYVSIEKQYSLSKEYVTNSISESSAALGAAITSGVHIYKISYNSKQTSTDSVTTQSSGLLIVPYTACTDSENTAPWVVLNHGTIVDDASAPTNNLREGLFEGGLGFIVVVPDYIGFGDSYNSDPSVRIHPYIIADSYAVDGFAIMKAASQILNANDITPGNLYLKGYSEGGYAALSLQRYLETSGQSDFTITASAPSAGPYSTVGLGALLTTSLADQTISPTLFGFLATSYYYNYPSTVGAAYELEDVFKQSESYDEDTLFNGQSSSTQTEAIYASLGISTINTLLESEVVSAMATDTGAIATGAAAIGVSDAGQSFAAAIAGMTDAFSAALFTNDILYGALAASAPDNYFPRVPTIFYHCSNDSTIYPSATSGAVATFQGLETSYSVTSTNTFSNTSQEGPESAPHSGCAFTLTPSVCFKEIEAAKALGLSAAQYMASPTAGSMCTN